MAIEYRYELEESGLAWVEVGCPGQRVQVSLDDATDGLREFAEATWMLAKGQYTNLPEGDAKYGLFWKARAGNTDGSSSAGTGWSWSSVSTARPERRPGRCRWMPPLRRSSRT